MTMQHILPQHRLISIFLRRGISPVSTSLGRIERAILVGTRCQYSAGSGLITAWESLRPVPMHAQPKSSRVESFKDMYSTANPGQDALYDESARQQLMGTYMGAKSQVADCSFSCVATQAMLDSVQAPSCTCGPNDLSCTCQTSTVEEVPGPCMP